VNLFSNGHPMVPSRAARFFSDPGRFVSLSSLDIPSTSLEDYFPIDLKNIIPNSVVTFPVYYPVYRTLRKELLFARLLESGESCTAETIQFFAEKGISVAYVHKSSLKILAGYLEDTTRSCINSPHVSTDQKTQFIYRHAAFLVERVFRDPRIGHVIGDASKWAKIVGTFLQKDEMTPACLCRIFSKDYTTFTHSIQVCLLGMAFGAYLKWGKEEIAEFGVGSLFHDLGKIWIDKRILQKPGTLSEKEFSHIRKHPRLGYRHLKGMGVIPTGALEIVLQHHENSDGQGYPLGLKGREIHPLARVAHIVDCYDALTTKRPYKGPLPPYKALKLMYEEMRTSFDLDLLKRFIHFLGR